MSPFRGGFRKEGLGSKSFLGERHDHGPSAHVCTCREHVANFRITWQKARRKSICRTPHLLALPPLKRIRYLSVMTFRWGAGPPQEVIRVFPVWIDIPA